MLINTAFRQVNVETPICIVFEDTNLVIKQCAIPYCSGEYNTYLTI